MRSGSIKRRTGKAVAWLLAGLLLGGGVGAGTMYLVKRQKSTVGGDANLAKADELAMVPADAVGFVHVRLADLWKSDAMEQFRKIVEKAGPQAVAALDEGFVPAPSSVDRVTVVFMPSNEGPRGAPQALAIVALSARFDADAFRTAYLPAAVKKTVGDKTMWNDPTSGVAAHFPKDKLLVIGMPDAVEAYCAKPPAADGPLANAIKEAGGGTRHLVGAVNMTQLPLPPRAFDEMPEEFRPLLKAQAISFGMALTTDAKVELRAVYMNELSAIDAEKAVKAAAERGRKALAEPKAEVELALNGPKNGAKPRPMDDLPKAVAALVALGGINTLDEFLANPPVKRTGTELAVTTNIPSLGGAYIGTMAMGVGFMLPAVQKVREAAERAKGSNNLKQMGLAMHNYESAMGKFPPAQWGTKLVGGKPTGNLSWRVAILPYIEHNALYQQFNHDEPWDSEHNKKLIPLMPKVYECPRAAAPPGMTYYKVFTPAPKSQFKTFFGTTTGMSVADVVDGTSNTIMVVEGGGPVTWTQPDDIVYDPKGKLPVLSLAGQDVIQVCLGDASIRTINLKAISEKTLRAAITADDGEVLGKDW